MDAYDEISVEINDRIKKVMDERGIGYGPAYQYLICNDRDLIRRQNEAKARRLANPGSVYSNQSSQVAILTSQKVAASEGQMEYSSALRMVLAENLDLARDYKRTFNRR